MKAINDRLAHALKHAQEMALERHLPGISDQRFIYFIACQEFVKIGIAANVDDRLNQMQTGNPYELRLLKVMESANAEQDEESIHCALERYRIRGEWFKLPPDVLALVLKPR